MNLFDTAAGDFEKKELASQLEQIFKKLSSGEPVGPLFGLDSSFSEALYSLGHFYVEQGKYETAIQIFSWMLMIDACDRRALVGAGICQRHLKKYEHALQSLGLAYLQDPTDGKLAVHIVHCLLENGQKENAKEMMEHIRRDMSRFSDSKRVSVLMENLKSFLSVDEDGEHSPA